MTKPRPDFAGSSLAARLNAVAGDLTKSEAKIAQWITMNEATAGLETGASLAAKIGVSEITVSRFLRRLGFKGMAALKEELQARGVNAHLQSADRYIRLLDGELGALIKRDAEATLGLGAQIVRPAWVEAVSCVDQADEVFVTGFQTVRGLAEDFARRLSIIRGSARFIAAHDTGLAEWIPSQRRVDDRRCLILIDMIPYAREAEVVARLAQQGGMDLVIVSDELNTWAVKFTPHVFYAGTKAGAFLESTGPLATLLNLLLHAVADRDPDKVQARLGKWPAIIRELELY
jgi:DNA-binding MurR/RpiR family transcriptional regulator